MRRIVAKKVVYCVSLFLLFGFIFLIRLQIRSAVSHIIYSKQLASNTRIGGIESFETGSQLSTFRPWFGNRVVEHDQTCTYRNVSLSDEALPLTGLISFPGSGNTWTRHLIQQMTGIGTSSVYCDRHLKEAGFPFECYHHRKNQTIVIKTHNPGHVPSFKKIVFLIRNPYDALLSFAKFKMSGHTKNPSVLKLREVIETAIEPLLEWYLELIMMVTQQFKGPVHVLQYEKLKSNMTAELIKLSKFLKTNINDENVKCTVKLQEGNFHRNTTERRHFQLLNFIYQGDILMRIKDTVRFSEDMLNDAYNLNINLRGPEKKLFNLRL